MIKGMTGFGSAQLAKNTVKAMVEIKTVNHRYFDISYYLPIGFGIIENKIRLLLQKNILRGRVTISVKITQQPEKSILLNKGAVRTYLKNANSLKREFKLDNDMSVSDLIKMPGVLEVKETLVRPEDLWPDLEKCLKRAIKSVDVMRKREGKSLLGDVTDQLKRMLLQSKKIEERLLSILNEKKKKLNDEEFRSLQKSTDINEEISRLNHYIEEMKKLLKSKNSVGKRMDFIAQEMQRETNTIGSKVQDKMISNAVIALKSKVEKIREQAQNIE